MPKPSTPNPPPADPAAAAEAEVARQLGRMTRRGLAIAAGAIAAGLLGRRWIFRQPKEGLVPWPLRRVLQFDERISHGLFDPKALAPTFARAKGGTPRVTGRYGLDPAPDPAAYRLKVEGPSGIRSFGLDEIKALPRHDLTTEMKCIEGWSAVVHWSGARLADLADLCGLAVRDPARPGSAPCDYAALETPDRAYYVGLEILAALHPQTLLCYEIDGRALTSLHGAPLRLAIPVKYGIKHLKNIGTIRFTDRRPPDFWADRGYDWFSGH